MASYDPLSADISLTDKATPTVEKVEKAASSLNNTLNQTRSSVRDAGRALDDLGRTRAADGLDGVTSKVDRLRRAQEEFATLRRSIPNAAYGIPGVSQLVEGAELASTILPQLGRGAIIAGGAIAGIGLAGYAAAKGIEKTWAEMEKLERKQFVLDQLSERFGSVEQVIATTQRALEGIASKEEILKVLVKLDQDSVRASEQQINALATVVQDRAFKVGANWTEMMAQVSEAIGKADGKTLESMGLIDDAGIAYLTYAESVGKLVPQLSEAEKQQALLNQVLIENKDAVAQMDSPIENLRQAQAELKSSTADLGAAWLDWAVSLLDPSARSAADWWAERLRGLIRDANALGEALNRDADIRMSRSQLSGESLEGFNALTQQSKRSRREIGKALEDAAREQGVSRDQIDAVALAKTDPVLAQILEKYNLMESAMQEAIDTAQSGGDVLSLPAVREALATDRLERFRAQAEQLRNDIAGLNRDIAETGGQSVGQGVMQAELDQKIEELRAAEAGIREEEAKITGILTPPAQANAERRSQLTSVVESLDQDIAAINEKITEARSVGSDYAALQDELAQLQDERAALLTQDPFSEVVKTNANDDTLRNAIIANIKATRQQIDGLYTAAASATNNGDAYIAETSVAKAKELETQLGKLQALLAGMPTLEIANAAQAGQGVERTLADLGRIEQRNAELRSQLSEGNLQLIGPNAVGDATRALEAIGGQASRVYAEINRRAEEEAQRVGTTVDKVDFAQLAQSDPVLGALVDKYDLLNRAVGEVIDTASNGKDALALPAVQQALAGNNIESFLGQIERVKGEIAGLKSDIQSANEGTAARSELEDALDAKIAELQSLQGQLRAEESKLAVAVTSPQDVNPQASQLTTLARSLDAEIQQLEDRIAAARTSGGKYAALQSELAQLQERRDILINADPAAEALKTKAGDDTLRNALISNVASIQQEIDRLYQEAANATDIGNAYVRDDSIKRAQELERQLVTIKGELATMPTVEITPEDEQNAAEKILDDLDKVNQRIEEVRRGLGDASVDVVDPDSIREAQRALNALQAQRAQVQGELDTLGVPAFGNSSALRDALSSQIATLQSQIATLYQDAAAAGAVGDVYVSNDSIVKAEELQARVETLRALLRDLPMLEAVDPQQAQRVQTVSERLIEVDKQIADIRSKLVSQPGALLDPDAVREAERALDALLQKRAQVQSELTSLSGAAGVGGQGAPISAEFLASVQDATEQLKGQNATVNNLNFDQFKASFENAAASVQQSTEALNGALASGDQTLIQQATRVNTLAQARLASLQALGNVITAEATLAQTQATGTEQEIAHAEAALKAAEAHKTAADAAYEAASVGNDLAAAQLNLAQAEKILAEAKASGNQAAIAQAQLMVSVAQAALLEAQAVQDATAASEGLSYVGGLILDEMTGLPVAFDRAGLSAEEMAKKLSNVSIELQNLQYNAQNAAFTLAGRLIPTLGLRGAISQGNAWAQEAKQITDGISTINQALTDQGKAPLSPQVLELGLQSLNNKWQAQLGEMTAPADAAADKVGQAFERAAQQTNTALNSMISGLIQPTTGGLINTDDILPREDAIDEKARRMADVAKKGFQSPWYEGLKDLFPPEIIEQGEGAVKQAAARMVRDHTQGMTTMFYDVDLAAQRVLDRINAKSQQNDFIDQVREKVKGLADVSDVDIQAALGIEVNPEDLVGGAKKSLDALKFDVNEFLKEITGAISGENSPLTQMVTLSEEDTTKITEGGKASATKVGESFTAQIKDGNYGGLAVAELYNQVTAKKSDSEQMGKDLASWAGGAYLDWWKDNVPTGLLQILVSELVPMLQEALAAEEERKSGGK